MSLIDRLLNTQMGAALAALLTMIIAGLAAFNVAVTDAQSIAILGIFNAVWLVILLGFGKSAGTLMARRAPSRSPPFSGSD